MNLLNNIKVIFWDFDGVLMDSNSIRDKGFELVLSEYPVDQVEELLIYHQENGGLSRYVKFRYFFENIREQSITDEQINVLAERFSSIMKDLLVNPDLLIDETLDFVKSNNNKYRMYITSGSAQDELRFLCKRLNIDHFFKSIHGSPKPKKEWIKELIDIKSYNPNECVLVGDSINDLEAAIFNNINFLPYNNSNLKSFLSK